MTQAELLFHEIAAALPEAQGGQLFGKPCYKIKGKAFVCFFKEAIVFKLQHPEHEKAMALDGAVLFDPSGKGRPMKEWVQLPFTQKASWKKLAAEAQHYVDA